MSLPYSAKSFEAGIWIYQSDQSAKKLGYDTDVADSGFMTFSGS